MTAKLSRQFYERFGDDIVNELVELLNQVDATYKSELRELNELNFARFDAKLEQRIAELRADLMQRLSELRAELMQRLAEFSVRLEQRLAEFGEQFEKRFERRFEQIDSRFERVEKRLDQQNRLFILAWVTLIAAVVGMGMR